VAEILAKIAMESEQRLPAAQWSASGEGWTACDLVCSAGPRDRPFEEQHGSTSIAVVVSGTFHYRSTAGGDFMTPGCLLLGNAGDSFCCGHEHGTGDRCLSFSYSPQFFETLASEGATSRTRFRTPRLAPVRAISPLVAKAARLLSAPHTAELETLAILLASEAIRLGTAIQPPTARVDESSVARVTRVVRFIEKEPNANGSLADFARVAGLSPYHFLRVFVAVAGVTPHQYLLRGRLRRAALLLRSERIKVVDVALDCGFSDVSNFNRAFRAEFGMTPRFYRAAG
jgi:AraC-like DNA-binding protein